MKRSTRRSLKKYRAATVFVAVFSILALVSFLAFIYFHDQQAVVTKKSTQKFEFTEYYVPIVHFTDIKNNISMEDLKKILIGDDKSYRLYLASEDEASVANMLGLSDGEKIQYIESSTKEIVNQIAEKPGGFSLAPVLSVDYRVKSLSVDGKNVWDKKQSDYPLSYKAVTTDKRVADNSFNKSNITLLTNVGDVILGRHVAYKMRTYNDYNHPWLKMADIVKRGDITFADLETPLSDVASPPDEGMNFIAPKKAISGLLLAGIDIVALANNHSTNFGVKAFTDTLDILTKSNIKYVGGGVNSAEAYQSTKMQVNGLRITFLNYNSIVGATNATTSSPGVAKFAIKPWTEIDDRDDIEKIKNNIKEAKKNSDLVVVEFHWGVEYTPNPIQSQINVAHAAIDSGADLVVGTHPHVVQAFESYKNVPIFYSLGNFIFDQEWSTETKQGVVAETYFYKKRLVSIKAIPYQIEDYNQPTTANPTQHKQIMNRIYNASLSSEFKQ